MPHRLFDQKHGVCSNDDIVSVLTYTSQFLLPQSEPEFTVVIGGVAVPSEVV